MTSVILICFDFFKPENKQKKIKGFITFEIAKTIV
jgi:hypothetical protein